MYQMWADPRYCAYHQQLTNAKRRGIEFRLTFEEWLAVWNESGRFNERGRGRYVMARKNDSGPYALGNVKIVTQRENNAEFFNNKTPEEVQRWKDGLNTHAPEAEAKRSVTMKRTRAERPWSNAPKDRERWVANLSQSGKEYQRRSPRTRDSKGRFVPIE